MTLLNTILENDFLVKTSSYIGWIGTLGILFGYLKVSMGHWDGENRIYLLLNLVSSILIIYGSVFLGALQPIFFNAFFGIISILGLFSLKFPGLKLEEKGFLTISVVVFALLLIQSGDLIGAMGSVSVVLFIGSYLLFTQSRISEKEFLSNNVLANFCYIWILLETNNTFGVFLVAVTTLIAGFGLMSIKKNKVFCS